MFHMCIHKKSSEKEMGWNGFMHRLLWHFSTLIQTRNVEFLIFATLLANAALDFLSFHEIIKNAKLRISLIEFSLTSDANYTSLKTYAMFIGCLVHCLYTFLGTNSLSYSRIWRNPTNKDFFREEK